MTVLAARAAPAGGEAEATDFLLRFARSGHDAGYSTTELEDRLVLLADALSIRALEVSATPTVIELSIGPLSNQQTYSLRVAPADVDLGAIARHDDLVHVVIDTPLDAATASVRLEQMDATPLRRSAIVTLGAFAGSGFALTPMLGGGRNEAIAAATVGAVVGAVALAGETSLRTRPVVAPLAAIAASFAAATVTHLGLDASQDLVTLAALVTLLPGMKLTIGMRELASEQLQSGVANTADALIQLLGLVFGVEVGRSLAAALLGTSLELAPGRSATATGLLCAALAGLAFTGTLRARTRDAPLMCLATLLAYSARTVLTDHVGPQPAVFGGALAVGTVGAVVGWRLRRSPLVFIVPGVLMLAPGSLGFDSVLKLLSDQTVSGVTAGFETVVTAGSIAYGLMIAAALVPARMAGLTAERARSQATRSP